MLSGNRLVFAGEFWYGATGHGLAHGLRAQGWDIAEVDVGNFLARSVGLPHRIAARLARPMAVRAYNAAIIEAAERYEPQALLTVKGSWISEDTLRRLRARGILTVNYYPDFRFAYPDLADGTIDLYDLFVTTKSFQLDYLGRRLGAARVAFLHHGYDDLAYYPRLKAIAEGDYRVDLLYVGNHSPYKERWAAAIARRLPDLSFRVVGAGWKNAAEPALRRAVLGGQLSGDFYARAVQRARINIAIHFGPAGPEGWQDLVSTRTFEIPACRGFMLHIDNSEVRGLFEPGREIDVFADEDALVGRIRHYLDRPALRAEMIERAYRRCVPAYGYAARAADLSQRISALLHARAGDEAVASPPRLGGPPLGETVS